MELVPQQEFISGQGVGNSFRLANLFDPATTPWSFLESNHVLMVTDRLAFFDKWTNPPTAALIRYERTLAGSLPKADAPMNYEALREYCLDVTVTAGKQSLWAASRVNMWNYRGINTHALDLSLGAMSLWERISKVERDQLLKEAVKNLKNTRPGYAKRPLSEYNKGDRVRLVNQLQNWGIHPFHSFHPHYHDEIAKAVLYIELRRWKDPTFPYVVRLSASPPEGSNSFIWGAEASFLWTE